MNTSGEELSANSGSAHLSMINRLLIISASGSAMFASDKLTDTRHIDRVAALVLSGVSRWYRDVEVDESQVLARFSRTTIEADD